jgi:hypothetical protein
MKAGSGMFAGTLDLRARAGRPAVALALAVAAATGCHRGGDSSDPSGSGSTPIGPAAHGAAPARTSPADHLEAEELLEGSQQAFGVVLPRVFRRTGAFVDVVYGTAPASVHALAQYFAAHVVDGSRRESQDVATFEHVHALGPSAGSPSGLAGTDGAATGAAAAAGATGATALVGAITPELAIRIVNAMGGASVEIRDATAPQAVTLPDEAARWKKVGLTPEGRLADPHHLD